MLLKEVPHISFGAASKQYINTSILKTVINCRDRLSFRLLQMGNLKKFWKKLPIRSITHLRGF